MTILVTGASGAVGGPLVDRLVSTGVRPRVASRHPDELRDRWPDLEAVELDVREPATLGPALDGVRAAYYLVHSMEPGPDGDFRARDAEGARRFGEAACDAGVGRVVYLGGLGEDDERLSEHLRSRHETGRILAEAGPPLLEFRAAIVVSAESASYTMLSDLVDRLPAMIVPRWVDTPTQPIAIDDVVSYLAGALDTPLREQHAIVQIGGPDVTTYRGMIETVAAERGKHPVVVGVPFLSPRLSSYWCGLTTSVPAAVARPLIDGLSVPVVVRDGSARERFPEIEPMPFAEAVRRADGWA
jgi:uncharacterized protein YbjT (DUF2867 family)